MRIDCHSHLYPLAIPGWFPRNFFKRTNGYYGLELQDLKKELWRREAKTGIQHGIFSGTNDPRALPKLPADVYTLKRVLPLIEHHPLQLIGVFPWDQVNKFDKFMVQKTQLDGIKYIADNGGIAIVDQPQPIYEGRDKTNSVFLEHTGEATVDELKSLTDKQKTRTFLCYDGIMPPVYMPPFTNFHKKAEELSDLTGLKLFGGSDTILRSSSLYTTYNNAPINDIRDIIDDPSLVGQIHKGSMPLWRMERYQRMIAAADEEFRMGLETREAAHTRMIDGYLSKSQ